MSSKKLVILDGNALLHRAYHAVTPLNSPDGAPVHVVFGFLSVFLTILDVENPDYFTVAFDTKAPTFRKEKCDTYKAGRTKPSDDFYDQIPKVYQTLDEMRIKKIMVDGFEADDILATLATQAERSDDDFEVILVTSDRDALQLVTNKTVVHDLHGGYRNAKIYTPELVEKRYGVTPTQFVDYKALLGDKSDNLSGVNGIGEKGASKLLQKYQTLSGIYEHLGELSACEKNKLEQGKIDAFFTQEMAQLRHDVPFDFEWSEFELDGISNQNVIDFLEKLGLRSIINRLQKLQNKRNKTKKHEDDSVQMSLF